MSRDVEIGALDGLRVLELADEKGEFCGKLAADMGADVIKIEPPCGSKTRMIGPFVDDVPDPDKSLFFWYYNTSKRSLTLNLGCDEGRRIFRQLVPKVDIILETYAPGHLDEMGLGYGPLAKIVPKLIMVSITPFGQTGPYRNFKTSDLVSLAMGGPIFSCGYDDVDVPNAPPIRPDGGHAHIMGCYQGFMGMLFALYQRDLDGNGQYVDCSIHEACSCSTEWALPVYAFNKRIVKRHTGRHASVRPNQQSQYLCRDGRYVNILGYPNNRNNWHEMLAWLENDVPLGDFKNKTYEDMLTLRTAPVDNPEVQRYTELISMFTAKHTSEEIYHGAQKRGLPCGIVRPPEETLKDHHLSDRGFFVEVEHDEIGRTVKYPGPPFQSSRMNYRVQRAPLIGEHNLEVYGGELGFSREKLTMLAEAGVI